MKFLANENFPFPSIEILRRAGLEVISISELCPGISDGDVILKAHQENLIILTFDKDYGEIIFKENLTNPPAVIFFRDKGSEPETGGNRLLEIIKEKLLFENKFTVIEENGVRQREYKHN
jgi:predicted nuclease of predicted toxin-antitoxin system